MDRLLQLCIISSFVSACSDGRIELGSKSDVGELPVVEPIQISSAPAFTWYTSDQQFEGDYISPERDDYVTIKYSKIIGIDATRTVILIQSLGHRPDASFDRHSLVCNEIRRYRLSSRLTTEPAKLEREHGDLLAKNPAENSCDATFSWTTPDISLTKDGQSVRLRAEGQHGEKHNEKHVYQLSAGSYPF